MRQREKDFASALKLAAHDQFADVSPDSFSLIMGKREKKVFPTYVYDARRCVITRI